MNATVTRNRTARVTLRFNRFFNGVRAGSHKQVVALSAPAIAAATRKQQGDGWGCKVVLSISQIHKLAGWASEDGVACIPVDFAGEWFDAIEVAS
jgi:hypothetical protein